MRRKTIDDTGVGDSGGSKALDRTMVKMNRGKMNTGPGRDKQNPAVQRNRKTLEEWCEGKRGTYK